ncbi:hypothetical protein SAMN05443252_107118 [Bacillus sp. OV322]|uniref:hypothetical protein n=1 Tax=Bacillus sp. OV322 TaxID=1882764 RepID=UPI0008F3E16F|nr:hypothetical protein [Bacillus sp. OV322]SFC86547.1 hypothetical protein SAMN05443252_107118 [Bacillus sp. OV322]
MIRIELLCREIKRLTDDYYKCENTVIKEQIYQDVKLLSEGLFLVSCRIIYRMKVRIGNMFIPSNYTASSSNIFLPFTVLKSL